MTKKSKSQSIEEIATCAYIAGLFDGEGSIYFAKRPEKKKKHKGKGYRVSISQRISMEITMTDESVIRWVHEVLNVGTVVRKPRKGLRKDGTKYLMQWKWRCTFRDAYSVCCLLWPYAHTKLPKIQQIIDHYSGKIINDKATEYALLAERSLIKQVNGNCFTPIAALAEINKERLTLQAKLFSEDGSIFSDKKLEGTTSNARKIGSTCAHFLINNLINKEKNEK